MCSEDVLAFGDVYSGDAKKGIEGIYLPAQFYNRIFILQIYFRDEIPIKQFPVLRSVDTYLRFVLIRRLNPYNLNLCIHMINSIYVYTAYNIQYNSAFLLSWFCFNLKHIIYISKAFVSLCLQCICSYAL